MTPIPNKFMEAGQIASDFVMDCICEPADGHEEWCVWNNLRKAIDKVKSEAEERGRKAGLDEVLDLIDDYQRAYSITLFPEPPKGEHGRVIDLCSARAGRHIMEGLAEQVRSLSKLFGS